ncbi:MAG: peptidylprolyl isomerase [Pseudomonadales bacterium]|nr:peptidylprolyl isomerase [Pseudomonadales bacterium]MDG1441951.1 peptidylprolyl isomerase [Pseudomonadales bacterium]
MRDPLLWFVLIGGILFGADHFLNSQADQIIVDDTVRQRLATLWQTQTGNPATAQEVDSLVQSWLKEEIMFREAMRLGLDRDDTIVRRRLIQKLSFLSEEVGIEATQQTKQDALMSYYDAHQEQYRTETRYTFQQIFFSTEENANQYVASALTPSIDWQSLGQTSLLNASFKEVTLSEVRRDFGVKFAKSLREFVEDTVAWQGPIKSSYGYHFVRLQQVKTEQQLPFAMVRAQVAADYASEQRSDSQADYYNALLDKYDVVYE